MQLISLMQLVKISNLNQDNSWLFQLLKSLKQSKMLMMILRKVFCVIFCLLLVPFAWSTNDQLTEAPLSTANIDQIKQEIIDISGRSTETLGYWGLTHRREKVEQLLKSVQICIKEEKHWIDQLQLLQTQLVSNQKFAISLAKDMTRDIDNQDLIREQNKHLERLNNCYVLNYKLTNLRQDVTYQMFKKNKTTLFQKAYPLWFAFINLKNTHWDMSDLFKNRLAPEQITDQTKVSVSQPTKLSSMFFGEEISINLCFKIVLLGLIGAVCGWLLSQKKSKLISQHGRLLTLISALWVITIYLINYVFYFINRTPLVYVFGSFAIYYSLVFLVKTKIPTGVFYKKIINFLRLLLINALVNIIVVNIFAITSEFVIGYNILIFIFTLAYYNLLKQIILAVNNYSYNIQVNIQQLLLKIVFVLCFVQVMLGIWGYIFLASNLMINVTLTLSVVQIILFWLTFLRNVEDILRTPGHPFSIKLHQLLGVGYHKPVFEFFALRILLNIQAILIAIVLILLIWQAPQYMIAYYGEIMLNKGLSFAEHVTIIPARILRGGILFCLFMLLGRMLSTMVAGNQRFKNDVHLQITIKNLTLYVSFIISALIMLMITGIDISGLSLIIGALSVGLGFGLQTFVKDFFSGIIILIQKPIRINDLVQLNDIQGYIKKIKLLSTQIMTDAHSDVIVPNSIIVSNALTNLTLHNTKIKLDESFIVGYDADIGLAQKIVLDVISQYPEIEQQGSNKPVVILDVIEDIKLLRNRYVVRVEFVLKNIAEKNAIISKINFDIINRYKENNIWPKDN